MYEIRDENIYDFICRYGSVLRTVRQISWEIYGNWDQSYRGVFESLWYQSK